MDSSQLSDFIRQCHYELTYLNNRLNSEVPAKNHATLIKQLKAVTLLIEKLTQYRELKLEKEEAIKK